MNQVCVVLLRIMVLLGHLVEAKCNYVNPSSSNNVLICDFRKCYCQHQFLACCKLFLVNYLPLISIF